MAIKVWNGLGICQRRMEVTKSGWVFLFLLSLSVTPVHTWFRRETQPRRVRALSWHDDDSFEASFNGRILVAFQCTCTVDSLITLAWCIYLRSVECNIPLGLTVPKVLGCFGFRHRLSYCSSTTRCTFTQTHLRNWNASIPLIIRVRHPTSSSSHLIRLLEKHTISLLIWRHWTESKQSDIENQHLCSRSYGGQSGSWTDKKSKNFRTADSHWILRSSTSLLIDCVISWGSHRTFVHMTNHKRGWQRGVEKFETKYLQFEGSVSWDNGWETTSAVRIREISVYRRHRSC